MKKDKLFIIILLFIFHCSLFTASAQSWQALMDSTKAYQEKQDYQTALQWAEKAESQAKTQFGEKDSNYITSLSQIYSCYYYLGKYQKAIEYCEKTKPIIKEIIGEKSQDYAFTLEWLGMLYNKIGDFKKAEPLYKESLELLRSIFKGDYPDLATSINNIAYFFENRGRYTEAEPLYKESLEMKRRLFNGDHPDLALGISNMANFYNIRGRYTEGESLLKEAYAMRRRLFKNDHPDLANSINAMAVFYENQGHFAEAELLYKQSIAMRRRLFKGGHPDLAQSINNMAYFYNGRGRFTEAEPLFMEAIEMFRRIFKGDYPDLAKTIGNMALFYNSRERYTEAEPFFKEALDMCKRLYKVDHPDLATSINNMAWFYNENGRYIEAEPLLKEALEINRRLFKGNHPNLASAINNIAGFYEDRGRCTEAEPLYKEALDMRRDLFKGNHPSVAQSINNLAGFYNGLGKYAVAEPLYIESLEVYKKILNNYFPSLSQKEKGQFWNTMNNNFIQFNSFVINRMKENPQILGNLFDIQLFTKSMLFNISNKIKKRILASNDSVLIAQYRELISKKELLYKLYSTPIAQVKKQGYDIDSIEAIANELEKEISLKSEDYKQSYERKKVTWKSIQTLLKPDEAAVEVVRFNLYKDRRFTDTVYYAFLIVTDQTEDHPDIVIIENGKELEEKYYAQYRNYMKNQLPDKESFGYFWQKLYDKLKDYKKIYFSPDGIYNKLNISTMLMPNGKYLLDEQQIHTLNSTQDILLGFYSKQEESNIYNSCELFGNPDFLLNPQKMKEIEQKYASLREMERSVDSTKTLTLQPLPGTEKEVKNISDFFKSRKWVVNMHTGDDAVKAAVKTVNNPRVLHIATHGLFLNDIKPDDKDILGMEGTRVLENPLLRSGLFFAGASKAIEEGFNPTGYDNGFLTAYEAQNMDLDRTELVVLSACETGLGEIHNGEGVFGLQRAFQQAGAKSVLMSLWKVNDEATQELMTTFYKEWVSGKTKREAFNAAQKKIKDKYKHPYYWGAFVMVGE